MSKTLIDGWRELIALYEEILPATEDRMMRVRRAREQAYDQIALLETPVVGSREWAQQMCDEGKSVRHKSWSRPQQHIFSPSFHIVDWRTRYPELTDGWEFYQEPQRAVGWYMAHHPDVGDEHFWWTGKKWQIAPDGLDVVRMKFSKFTNIRPITIGEPEQ